MSKIEIKLTIQNIEHVEPGRLYLMDKALAKVMLKVGCQVSDIAMITESIVRSKYQPIN